MKKIAFSQKVGIAFALYLCLTIIYVATNHWIQTRHAFLVHSSIEDKIPFIPEFIYFYALGYLSLLAFPIFFVNDKKIFYLICKGILWIIVSNGVIFCIFPTTTLRPHIEPTNYTLFFLSILYNNDPPNNCFPSLHVSLTTYIAVIIHKHDYWKNYPLIISCSVCASTLFIKEHALVDVIGGLAYAYLTLNIFDKETFIEEDDKMSL